ncbi:MAG: YggS family pyridoxal phosphate-dependent enzyme [candidate division WOR-3 bacterium]
MNPTDISENLARVKSEIASACARAGRKPDEVSLLLVTKTFPPETIKVAYDLGHRLFGENRVQEAAEKVKRLPPDITWHMVGHLQTNKVKRALDLFSVIESVDRLPLAEEISRRATRPIPCLLEVNTSGEESKFGIAPGEARFLAEKILSLPRIKLVGLMTLGPYPVSEKASRKAFALLRETRDAIQKEFGISLPVLSMGMSEDYIWAIEEGATEVRLGRAVFGPRVV